MIFWTENVSLSVTGSDSLKSVLRFLVRGCAGFWNLEIQIFLKPCISASFGVWCNWYQTGTYLCENIGCQLLVLVLNWNLLKLGPNWNLTGTCLSENPGFQLSFRFPRAIQPEMMRNLSSMFLTDLAATIPEKCRLPEDFSALETGT